MSTPWTPGPWRKVTNRDGSINIVSAKNADGESIKIALVNNRNHGNADILLAAPEMAEVLDGTTGAFMAALLEIMAARLVMLGAAEDDDIVAEAKHRAAKTRALLARIKGEAS
jgi:hypothetical protein